MKALTTNEKLVLYGLVAYSDLNDRELSERLDIKHSTVTSIRHRLSRERYFTTVRVPILQNLGCELLGVTYTQFNVTYPLEKRLKRTREAIEISKELFFSMGDVNRGFSLSISSNYTTIEQINDIRTETFSKMNLLGERRPVGVIFPFQISHVFRFLNFAPIIRGMFNIDQDFPDLPASKEIDFNPNTIVGLSNNEKLVYYALVKYPTLTDKAIGEKLPLSRHTVANMRKRFEDQHLIQTLRIPNLKMLKGKVLAFYHLRFNPAIGMSRETFQNEIVLPNTIFAASRRFEGIVINMFQEFSEYNMAETRMLKSLKDSGILATDILTDVYDLSRTQVIKSIEFAPFVGKLFDIDIDI